MKVAIIQQDIAWEDAGKNKVVIEQLFSEMNMEVDLVVLPEMFLTGFSMNTAKTACSIESENIKWLKKLSSERNVAILGSLAIEDKHHIYNRALFIHPDGKLDFYDKKHLFTMGDETQFFSPGNQRVIINYKGVRIMPLICYDLRFPVWSRNNNEYDLLVYMANWPEARRNVWDVLLKARAIENQCYVIGVNRVGNGGGVQYNGGTVFIDFKGDVSADLNEVSNAFEIVNVNIEELNKFRVKFPVLLDADYFYYNQ